MQTLHTKRDLWLEYIHVSKETMGFVLRHFLQNRVCNEKNTPRFFCLRFGNPDPWHSFNMKNQLTHVHPLGSAWCLLQTQYAKKPKNPV